ncbi:Oxidoreductase FAD/NAD(P)-binding protein [Macrophomina phaseolina MS6]|uniref:Oxidoreductase FAD/NAD(P)-binding protein n=1 Tax=Macrophomina phaseolina (strain MS6) TaxID=1126212 RepID=K2SX56_MACPH|nr:Oxidoreductase FAD/NAD(P)-binding protein [Macrophomina phaseolina MS6]
MPRPHLLHASLRPNAGVLLVLGGSAAAGFGYRYWATASKDTDSAAAESTTLHPALFSRYTIAAREPVSSTSTLFTLRARDDPAAAAQQDLRDFWRRAVWSVEAKQPQLQIARAYTPLPPLPTSTDASAEELRFLIRRERGGEVSGYLHRLPDGATVELRGPHVEFAVPEDVREVLFLAGGTGIAPALQVARALQMRGGETRMRILWASRRREDCVGGSSDADNEGASGGWRRWLGLGKQEQKKDDDGEGGVKGVIVKQIEALKRHAAPDQQLAVDYFVDEEKSFIQPGQVAHLLQQSDKSAAGRAPGSRLILISGPDGFLDYWSGRKVWAEEGEVQGPLRGALSRMDLKGWNVWKL